MARYWYGSGLMEGVLERLLGRTRTPGAELLAALLLIVGVAADLSGVPIAAEVLFVAGVALATLTGGWRGGVLALLAPFARIFWRPDAVAVGSFAECLVIMAVVAIMRRIALRLTEARRKLHALFAPLTDIVMMLDEDGTYLEVAPTNPRLLRRPAEELIGRRITDVFPAEEAERYVSKIREALSTHRVVNFDYERVIDSRTVSLTARITPLSHRKVLWVTRDVSRSEERYRSIVDQAGEIIFELDTKGTILSLNPAFERILGWRTAEWIGRSFDQLIAPEVLPLVRDTFKRSLEGGGVPPMPTKAVAADGRRFILETGLTRQVIDGEVVGVFGVARDITERQRQEDLLRRSEIQLRESQRIAGLGSWEADLHTHELWWSDQHYRLFGLEPGTRMSFERFLSLLDPPNQQKVLDIEKLRSTSFSETELTISLPDGSKRDLYCLSRGEEEAGTMVRIVGITQDVTERKRADALLRESEERLRLMAQATNDVVWDWKAGAGTIWWSSAYTKLFGYEPNELPHSLQERLERVHPDDRERVQAILREALDSGMDSFSAEYRYRRADGTFAVVLNRAVILRDETKAVIRIVGAMADITERKQLEEQLAHTRRVNSLGRVAASVAHEFNNVLMGILPNVEVIRKKAPAGLEQPINNVLTSLQRGKRVTDEVLRFTRPAAPTLKCVDVRKFLGRWADEIRPRLPNVTLAVSAEPDIYMHADALQISQVLTNLAINAHDAMPDGGRLTVSAEIGKSFSSIGFGVKTADGFVQFKCADTGAGIPADRMPHIFEPLFSTKQTGTGLGLAISYQLVLRHGGHMFVESEVGKGSTFHVLVPATHPIVSEVEDGVNLELRVRRVLLVEDEVTVAAGMKMLLESEGVTVDIVHTGIEAVPAINRVTPDAVVLDIGLPDCEGTDVYREIEKRWPHLPILFSSGHADAAKLDPYLKRQNVGLLLKPYDFASFREALRPLVGAPASVD